MVMGVVPGLVMNSQPQGGTKFGCVFFWVGCLPFIREGVSDYAAIVLLVSCTAPSCDGA